MFKSLFMKYLNFAGSSEENDNDVVTALACKSLNLSQALHEKCLHLEASASSEEEDPVRALQVPQIWGRCQWPEKNATLHPWKKGHFQK